MPRHEFFHPFARLWDVACADRFEIGLADLGKQRLDLLRACTRYGAQRLGTSEQAFGPGTV